ncbi:MAG: LacI family DNA-binding transcriptional regulator [Bacillota bacterium]|nr:LacI family DNA-binding transcriptional regulator [Bacillota bacterium]
MTRLKDIADALNLSTSTVSRVVNNQDRVDPERRRRVLATMKQLNYQPNDNARRLKTNSSNVIGVIVPDISNPYYAAVIKGIERKAMATGWSVLLCNSDEQAEREVQAVRLLMRQKVAAIIAAPSVDQASIPDLYGSLECPVVFFDNVPNNLRSIFAVTVDNVRAVSDLVHYMLTCGHRRIFMITGPAGESSADERLSGWMQSLLKAGIEPGPDWFGRGDFREDSGKAIMEQFLERTDRPTAIIAANNLMAYGAVKAIEALGLRIPEDMSIGAFDIVDTTGLMRLSITTVVEPAEEIGQVAADLSIAAGRKGSDQAYQKVVLEHVFCPNMTVRNLSV